MQINEWFRPHNWRTGNKSACEKQWTQFYNAVLQILVRNLIKCLKVTSVYDRPLIKSEVAPQVIFLPQVGENIAGRIFTAVVLAHVNSLNIADNLYEVLLQDVTFTFQSLLWSFLIEDLTFKRTGTSCRTRDTFLTWCGHIGDLKNNF